MNLEWWYEELEVGEFKSLFTLQNRFRNIR
jgi:hypothetical protein